MMVDPGLVDTHNKFECPLRLEACEFCELTFPFKELHSHAVRAALGLTRTPRLRSAPLHLRGAAS